jgi:hypothetical protein
MKQTAMRKTKHSTARTVYFQRSAGRYMPHDRSVTYFVLTAQVYTTVVNATAYWSFLCLYVTLVAIACSQLQKLQAGLNNFRMKSPMNPDTEQKELHECIRQHQNILR